MEKLYDNRLIEYFKKNLDFDMCKKFNGLVFNVKHEDNKYQYNFLATLDIACLALNLCEHRNMRLDDAIDEAQHISEYFQEEEVKKFRYKEGSWLDAKSIKGRAKYLIIKFHKRQSKKEKAHLNENIKKLEEIEQYEEMLERDLIK